jgi:hypothetical protein
MAADTTFFDVLEADLRALCAESYRPDNLATQITGWLSHTDYPQLKEASERAAMKLRTIPQDKSGVVTVRNSKVRLFHAPPTPWQQCASRSTLLPHKQTSATASSNEHGCRPAAAASSDRPATALTALSW